MVNKLFLSGENFEQDIRPLVQAFSQAIMIEVEKPDRMPEVVPEASVAIEIQQGLINIIYNNGIKTYSATEKLQEQEHKALRNEILRVIYRLFIEAGEKPLPWGILTGIRPTKLILEQVETDVPKTDINRGMKDIYYCSPEKLEQGLRIAKRENELLKHVPIEDTYSIYVGIPFCPSICNYCSFSSYPYEKYGYLEEAYVQALTKEIEQMAEFLGDRKPCTVYFGGGTPTTLSTERLRLLIRKIKECFPMDLVSEFSVEAGRADTITMEKLLMLKEEKVTRISINPQSMRERTLELIGRRHTVEQVEEAFRMARQAGHKNINMDIILGLTGESPEDVNYTLDRIDKLQPEGITVHTLARKRAARLTTDRKLYEGMEAVDVLGMFELSQRYTKEHGYEPYYMYRQKYVSENLENVGYAKPGFECLYNILIMEDKQTIVALGAGAVTKRVFPDGRIERCDNVKDVKQYIDRIDEMIGRKKELL